MDKVKTHQDYKAKYAENLDEHTRRLAFLKILNDIVNQDRKGALDFYKLFAGDEAFRTGIADSLERALGAR